jgi:hypothetical protein
MLRENGRGQSYAARSRMHGRGRRTSLPVAPVMLLSSRLKMLTVANLVEERAMWGGGNVQVSYSLLQYVYVALLLSTTVHNDVLLR